MPVLAVVLLLVGMSSAPSPRAYPSAALSRAAVAVMPPPLPRADPPVAWAAPLFRAAPAVARAAPPSRAAPAVARAPGSPGGSAYAWPVSPPRVVRRFEPPPEPWLAGHRGVDLAVPPGTRVRATGDGVVRYAGVLFGRGVVSLANPAGLRTTYEPVTSALRAGDRVRIGDVIGTIDSGHPGCPAEACLHWGLRRGDAYLDPLALLGVGRVRLLPLAGRAAYRLGALPPVPSRDRWPPVPSRDLSWRPYCGVLSLECRQQGGEAFGQAVVVLGPVVDLGAQPQPATPAPRVDRGLRGELVGDMLA